MARKLGATKAELKTLQAQRQELQQSLREQQEVGRFMMGYCDLHSVYLEAISQDERYRIFQTGSRYTLYIYIYYGYEYDVLYYGRNVFFPYCYS